MHTFQARKRDAAPAGALDGNGLSPMRRKHLAVALLAAILLESASFGAYADQSTSSHSDAPLLHRDASKPASQSWTVQNCGDNGVGSLRYVILNQAQSGDTVDLTALACSSITLTSGEVVVDQENLTLIGPGAEVVTIFAGASARNFQHVGYGTFSVQGLMVAGGQLHLNSNNAARGGCIESRGSVYLKTSVVTGCAAINDGPLAFGGGIHAAHDVTLVLSSVIGNEVSAPSAAGGGGIAAVSLHAEYSSISGNTAHQTQVYASNGGGAYVVPGETTIIASTIDGNTAMEGGALSCDGPIKLINTTISGNSAEDHAAVISVGELSIANSTIAYNHSEFDASAAVDIEGLAGPQDIQSSIIAKNTAGAQNATSDLYVAAGVLLLTGSDNLVNASNVSPSGLITRTGDPHLGPLQANGGKTRTHALLSASPAIGAGNNNASQPFDQRGVGYPRTSGPVASTDIGAFQFDTIFAWTD